MQIPGIGLRLEGRWRRDYPVGSTRQTGATGEDVRVHIAVFAAALALGGCSWNDNRWLPREVFNPAETAWSQAPGANSVSGQVLLASLSGELRSCANQTIRLIPDSGYARLRFMELYGSDVAGMSSGLHFGTYGPDRSDPRYLIAARSTTCDASGTFKFDGLANGTYYVLSTMLWSSTNMADAPGTAAFKRVQVKDGQSVEVSLP